MTEERDFEALRDAVAGARGPADDPRWDALARGALSHEAREELRAWAERDPEAAVMWETCQPLDARERARIAERVAPAPRGRLLKLLVPLGALAAAAVLLLFLRTAGPPMPGYELSVMGGEQTQRATGAGAPSSPPRLLRASAIELVARPTTRIQGDVAAAGFAVRGPVATPLGVTPTISPQGSVRIAGAASEVFRGVAAGTIDVVVVVARPGALPDAATVARGGPIPHAVTLRTAVELAE